jgi:hypothetical protein
MWEALGVLLKKCLFGDDEGTDDYTYVYINEDIPGEKNNNLYYLMAELG